MVVWSQGEWVLGGARAVIILGKPWRGREQTFSFQSMLVFPTSRIQPGVSRGSDC